MMLLVKSTESTVHGSTQVLRDKIGTAMTNIKSRADQFSLIIHSQEGEGEAQEGFLKKGRADVCGTHRCVPV